MRNRLPPLPRYSRSLLCSSREMSLCGACGQDGNIVIACGQLRRLHVLRLEGGGEGIGKAFFAVTGEQVHLGQSFADHIVNGAGQLAFSLEGPVLGSVVVIAVVVQHENVVVVHIPKPLAGLDDEAVFRKAVGILLGEGGEHVRVLLHHMDAVTEGGVAAKERFQIALLLAAPDDPVDGHVVGQSGHDLLRLLGQGEQLVGGGVESGGGGGEGGGQNVDHNDDGQRNGCDHDAVAPRFEGAGGEGRAEFFPAEIGLFHSLHLRFSRDCTLRNRKNPVIDR